MSTQIDLGPVLSIPKGDWNADTTYERLNLVRYNSASWICTVATSKGVEPTEDSADWYLQVKDTSSVTSVNGMRGDVVVTSTETPPVNDSSNRIATTEWVTDKLGDVDLSGIKDDTILAAQNASSLEVGAGDLTSAELIAIIGDEVARCLKTSGGTMSGPIVGSGDIITGKDNTNYIQLCGGTAYGKGASIRIDGKDSFNPGLIILHASDSTKYQDLRVDPSSVKINDSDVLTSAGGELSGVLYSTGGYPIRSSVDNGRIEISGSYSSGGGLLLLYGKNHADYPSECRLIAGDTNFRVLANGSAMLAGRAVNTIYSSGTNYIRYTNGLQLCWGDCSHAAWTTFPAAFKAKPKVVVSHSMAGTSGGTNSTGVYVENATRFYYKDAGTGNNGFWLAMGFWK